MKLYRIRRKSDGLFASELYIFNDLPFDEIGKSVSLDYLEKYFNKKHIDFTERFKDCEIVEFEIRETNKVNPGQILFEKAMFERL